MWIIMLNFIEQVLLLAGLLSGLRLICLRRRQDLGRSFLEAIKRGLCHGANHHNMAAGGLQ